jgi:hypothetical protein
MTGQEHSHARRRAQLAQRCLLRDRVLVVFFFLRYAMLLVRLYGTSNTLADIITVPIADTITVPIADATPNAAADAISHAFAVPSADARPHPNDRANDRAQAIYALRRDQTRPWFGHVLYRQHQPGRADR